jgi:hypothetical protein
MILIKNLNFGNMLVENLSHVPIKVSDVSMIYLFLSTNMINNHVGISTVQKVCKCT